MDKSEYRDILFQLHQREAEDKCGSLIDLLSPQAIVELYDLVYDYVDSNGNSRIITILLDMLAHVVEYGHTKEQNTTTGNSGAK